MNGNGDAYAMRTPSRAAGRAVGLAMATALGIHCVLAPPSASAQAGGASGAGPLVLEMVPGARSLALGGALWAGGDGAHALFSHPALTTGEGFEVSLRRVGDASHVVGGGSGEWMGGVVALGVASLAYGTSVDSPLDWPRDEHDLLVGGDLDASEFLVAAGFATEVRGTDVGAAAKAVERRVGRLAGSTVAVDLGVARELGPVTAALTVRNLGPGMKLGSRDVPLDARLALAAATRRAPVGPFDVGVAARVERSGAGHVLPGGGVEIAWWPVLRRTFVLRLGAERSVNSDASPLTLGAGFEGDRIRIDYALTHHARGRLEARAHAFALAFR